MIIVTRNSRFHFRIKENCRDRYIYRLYVNKPEGK